MTSNVGSLYLLDGLSDDGEIREDARERVMGELRSQFRPEFLNRVDEIVLFKPLTLGESSASSTCRSPTCRRGSPAGGSSSS